MIVFLTTSDTDILTLDRVRPDLPSDFGDTLALNPFAPLQDEDASERFLSETLPDATLALVRLLGGDKAMGERFTRFEEACRNLGIPLVTCSGEPARDAVFERRSTTPPVLAQTAFEYLNHGGAANLDNLLRFLSDEVRGTDYGYGPPLPLPQDGVYRPGRTDAVPLDEYRRLYCDDDKPTAALLFYRAHWVSQNVEFIDAMLDALERRGCNALPVFCSSLREDDGAIFRKYLMDEEGRATVDVVVCTQSFAMSQNRGPHVANSSDENWDVDILESLDRPILQAIVATEPQATWEERDIGLSPLDTAMNVALPELDGRVITAPVSFKESVSQKGGVGRRAAPLRSEPGTRRLGGGACGPVREAARNSRVRAQGRDRPQQLSHEGVAAWKRRRLGHSGVCHQLASRHERRRVHYRGHPIRRRRADAKAHRAMHVRRGLPDS